MGWRPLASRWAPVVFGALTALEMGWVWGSLDPVPVIQDEAAYLFQARVFASGHWTVPPPPRPEFFEQFQLLITPARAGKYPPGHPLLLVPGIWVGAPGLVPILLTGIAGGLVFLLARKFANPWVALLTWLLWTTSAGNLRFLPSYYSQNSTVVLWLAGWWALARWRETGRGGWLVALAADVAWQVLTRPFTAFPFAVTAGWIAGRDIVARKAWRAAAASAAAALAILAIIPLWSARTTGDWLTTPYALYSRTYFPYQRPGFGLPPAQPRRPLPPDMAVYADRWRSLHASFVPAMVPRVLRARLEAVGRDTWGDLEGFGGESWGNRRVFLSVFAMIGALAMPPAGLFALATGAAEIASHLIFAHPWSWSLYYLELQAPLAFLTAMGIWTSLVFLLERPRPPRALLAQASAPRAAAAAVAVALLLAWPLSKNVTFARPAEAARSRYFESFREKLRSIPSPRSMVFVRYAPRHDPERSLISNEPDLERARVWVVYDRGPENVELQALAPGRDAYLYDEERDDLIRLERPP